MIDQITSRRLFHKLARLARAAVGMPSPARSRLAARRIVAAARCETADVESESTNRSKRLR